MTDIENVVLHLRNASNELTATFRAMNDLRIKNSDQINIWYYTKKERLDIALMLIESILSDINPYGE